MDVVLGVAVAGQTARLALYGSGNVIDQSVVDLANSPVEKLTETVVGTNRLLADESHRLVATRLCWTDHPQADRLRRALEDSGVHNVAVLSESQAATALMRAAGRPGAVLVYGDDTATLSVPALAAEDENAPPTMLAAQSLAADSTGALDTMMARLSGQPGAPRDIYLVGASDITMANLTAVADQIRDASATTRVEIPEDPTFALARGAALAAAPASLGPGATMAAPALTSAATTMAPALDATGMSPGATGMVPTSGFAEPNAAEDQQLAYSQADDAEPLSGGMDEYGDEYDGYDDDDYAYDDPDADTGPLKLSRKSLLVGNAVVAFAVIGVASLAVAVVVGVRPTSASQPVIGHQNAAPGKFMPLLPTQQQAPVPPPPPDQPNAGFQGGVIPDTNGYIPPQLTSPGGGGGPAPAVVPVPGNVGTPGFVPNPVLPIPIPIIIPFPNWHPGLPIPPWPRPIPPRPFPPSSTTLTPPSGVTSTPTPPTKTTEPLVPTTTPPTKTPLVPSTTPPTTALTPTTKPPTTTLPTTTLPTTTKAPTSQAPTTTAPPPVTTSVQTPKPQTTQPPVQTTQPPVQTHTQPPQTQQTQPPVQTHTQPPVQTQPQQPQRTFGPHH